MKSSAVTERKSNKNIKEAWMRRVLSHRADAKALYLLEHGLRTSIMQIETGLPACRIRELAHGVAGLAGTPVELTSGALPEARTILSTNNATGAEATLFILLYVKIAGEQNARSRIDIDAVIKAHNLLTRKREQFGSVFTAKPLEINLCWVLAREYRTHHALSPTLQIKRCTTCNTPYVTTLSQARRSPCYFCMATPITHKMSEEIYVSME